MQYTKNGAKCEECIFVVPLSMRSAAAQRPISLMPAPLDASDSPKSCLRRALQLQRHGFSHAVMESRLFESRVMLLHRMRSCFLCMVDYIYSATRNTVGGGVVVGGVFAAREKHKWMQWFLTHTGPGSIKYTKFDWICLNFEASET